MSKRVAAVLLSISTMGALTAPSTLAAAEATGTVDQVESYASLDYGFVGHFSNDLSTLVFIVRGSPTPPGLAEGDLVIVNLETDQRRVLPTPDTVASNEAVVGLSADGSVLLVSADWEGVESGDEDGGFLDAFLVNTSTGDIELISGDLDDAAVRPLDLDSAGDTVLLASYSTTSADDGSLIVVDGGTLIDVTPPINPLNATQGTGLAVLSGDGQSMLYGTRSGFQPVWRLRNLATSVETVVAAPDGSQPAISDDGQTVIAGGWRNDGNSDLYVWDTSTTRVDRSVIPFQFSHFLSADGSTIAGTSNNYGNEEFPEMALWLHDLGTGDSKQVLTSTDVNFGFNAVGIDETGDRVAFTTPTQLNRSSPITLEELFNSSGEISDRLYIFDRNGSRDPSMRPGYSGSLDDQIERLYRAYFDRAPDADGLTFWREQRAGGRSLNSVSDEFARSPEFVRTYGDLADEDFVDLVYLNVLDRSPDAGGRAFWLDQLSNGRARGSVMTLFSESPEFIQATQTSTPENPTAAEVRRLYASFFVRDADQAGVDYWVGEAERGVSIQEITESLYLSEEFQSYYGELQGDPFTLVRVAYRNTFNREADYEGYELAGLVLEGQISIAEMLLQIANLPEFIALTSSTPVGG